MKPIPPRQTLLSYLDDFRRRGESLAFVGWRGLRTDRWSYRRLAETASMVAGRLRQMGLRKGDRVLLWSENSPAWVAVFFGCLREGIVVVPLDPQNSLPFVERVQSQVQGKVLLHGGDLLPEKESFSIPVMTLDELVARQNSQYSVQPQPNVSPDDLVEIVYTSGTTSEPRGIQLTHGNLLSNLAPLEGEMHRYRWLVSAFHPLRFLNLVPLSHVFGQLMGMLIPPLLGGEVWFLNSFRPTKVLETIQQRKISVLITVPRFLDTLKESLEKKAILAKEMARAGTAGSRFLGNVWRGRAVHRHFGWKFWAFVSGGATLNAATADFWRRQGLAVVQGYGMTETAALVSVMHPLKPKYGSIGKALPGHEIKITPEGEILVRSQSVSRGIWGKDGPHIPLKDDQGWLHTGDLARKDFDGNLFFLGRQKEVIVTSAGLNIYPEDLERALNEQPEIRGCAVVGVEQKQGPEPFAILLVKESGNPQKAVERANLVLAPHQQIHHWTVWPERDFPRTSNQKILKRELIARLNPSAQNPGSILSVTDKSKELDALAKMVAEVVGGEESDVNGSSQLAKDLKLDSLGKIALLNRLEEEYQIEIAEDQFSSVNTLGELKGLLAAQSQAKDDQKIILPAGARPLSQPSSMRLPEISATRAENFPYPFPAWPMRLTVTALRCLFSALFIHPLTWLLARPLLKGQDLLKDLSPPVLLVSNHVTFLDPALVLYALPRQLRRSVAVAMDGERLRDWRHAMGNSLLTRLFSPLAYLAVVALFNVFPLPRKGSFRRSFEYAGEAMDRGYSVLVFPEGLRTLNGQPAPFQKGIGVLAAGLNATVVPLRLEGLFEIKQLVMKGKRRIPCSRAGEITVRFGKPIHASDLSKDPSETTRFLESTIRNLSS